MIILLTYIIITLINHYQFYDTTIIDITFLSSIFLALPSNRFLLLFIVTLIIGTTILIIYRRSTTGASLASVKSKKLLIEIGT